MQLYFLSYSAAIVVLDCGLALLFPLGADARPTHQEVVKELISEKAYCKD